MLIVCGPSCIGKDTIGKMFEELGWRKMVSYTTRPKREGEVQGKDYIFINEMYFNSMDDHDLFIETTEYVQEDGSIWRYGTHRNYFEQDNSKTYAIMNPEGIYKLKAAGVKFDILYLKPDDTMDEVLHERYLSRGGDDSKWFTRRTQDFKDFGIFRNKIKDGEFDPLVLKIDSTVTTKTLKKRASTIDEVGFEMFKMIEKFNKDFEEHNYIIAIVAKSPDIIE